MDKITYVLASKSPRRKELLQNIGINAQIIPSTVNEEPYKSLPPEEMVRELAMLKAADVARSLRGKTVVIGADTCVSFENRVFGKPSTIAEAENMLATLSGKTHEVYTGVCIFNCADGRAAAKSQVTRVTFRTLSEHEIKSYVKSREPMDKAGSYGIQRLGSLFVSRIEGDYFNVVGLPICMLSTMLKSEFDIDII